MMYAAAEVTAVENKVDLTALFGTDFTAYRSEPIFFGKQMTGDPVVNPREVAMSLQHLFTSKSAQFFRVNPFRRLSNTAVARLVRKVSGNRTGRFEERIIRQPQAVDGAESYVTYCCFAIESEPSFLRDSDLRDTRYAYLLLIEAPEAIAVLRRNVEGVLQGLAPYVSPWKYDELGGVFCDENTAFERISLRNMSVASNVVRRRTLEASLTRWQWPEFTDRSQIIGHAVRRALIRLPLEMHAFPARTRALH